MGILNDFQAQKQAQEQTETQNNSFVAPTAEVITAPNNDMEQVRDNEISSFANQYSREMVDNANSQIAAGFVTREDSDPIRWKNTIDTAKGLGYGEDSYNMIYDDLEDYQKAWKEKEVRKYVDNCDAIKNLCVKDPAVLQKMDTMSAKAMYDLNMNMAVYGRPDKPNAVVAFGKRLAYETSRSNQQQNISNLALDVMGKRGLERDEAVATWRSARNEYERLPELDIDDYGTINSFLLATANQVPVQGQIYGAAIVGGATGAAIGGGIGFATPVPFGAGVGAATGAKLGSKAAVAYQSYRMETGSMMDSLLDLRDNDGKELDPTIMDWASRTYGVLAAGIEVAGLDTITATIPGVKNITKVGIKRAIAEAIKDKTKRDVIMGIIKDYGLAVAAESAEEMSQQLTQSTVTAGAKALMNALYDTNFEQDSAEQVFSEALEAGEMAAKATTVMGGVGSGMRVRSELKAYNQQQTLLKGKMAKAQYDAATLDKVAEKAQEYMQSPSAEKNTLKAYMQEAKKQSVYKDIYMSADEAKAFMLSDAVKNNIETLKASGLYNDMQKQIAEAEGLGNPVRIAFEDFGAEILSNQELYAACKDMIKTYEDGITVGDIKKKIEADKKIRQAVEQAAKDNEADYDFAYNWLMEQLNVGGIDKQRRAPTAEMQAKIAVYFAKNSNTPIDVFMQKYAPTFERSFDGNINGGARVNNIIDTLRDNAADTEVQNLMKRAGELGKKDAKAIAKILADKMRDASAGDVKQFMKIANAIGEMRLNLENMTNDQIIDKLGEYGRSANIKVDIKRDDIERTKSGIYSASENALKDIQNAGGSSDYVLVGGGRIPVNYEVVDLADMQTSHDDTGAINENYPQFLQPRDRSRTASDAQITAIVNNFAPERVAKAEIATEGAPIVTDKGYVAVGNGRAMAIRQMYKDEAKAQKYKDYLVSKGYDISNKAQPVLIRRLGMAMTDEQLKALVDDANTAGTMQYSDSENAIRDANKMSGNLLDLLDMDADIDSAANRKFLNAFFADVVPMAERNAYLDKDDKITRKGVERVENALVAKLLPDTRFLSILVENPDNNIRKVTTALSKTAPAIISFENEVAAGRVSEQYSIATDVAGAVDLLKRAKDRGVGVGEYLAMQDMFAEPISSSTQSMVQLFENANGAVDFLGKIRSYIRQATAQGDTQQTSMFAVEPITKQELLDTEAQQQSLFQFAGRKAKTANKDALSQARQLEANGMDNETIRQQTGWFKGVDGKWRFEISDKDAEIITDGIKDIQQTPAQRLQELYEDIDYFKNFRKKNPDLISEEEVNDLVSNKYRRIEELEYNISHGMEDSFTNLETVLKHDKLFDAYPSLRNVVVVAESLKDGVEGVARTSRNEIALDKSVLENSEKLKSVLLHEIQHVIQGKENFARGGSSTNAKENVLKQIRKTISQSDYNQIQEKYDDLYLLYDVINFNKIAKNPDALLKSAWHDEHGHFTHPKKGQKGYKEYLNEMYNKWYTYISNKYEGEKQYDFDALRERDDKYLRNQARKISRQIDNLYEQPDVKKAIKAKNLEPQIKDSLDYEVYSRLAGEVEARNTQARMNMSDEERAAATPESTQDIKNADAIVVFDDGTMLAYEPQVGDFGDININTIKLKKNLSDEEFKTKMLETLKSFKGRKIFNSSLNGDIEIRTSSIKKYKSFFADNNKRLIVPYIPEMLSKAKFVKETSYTPETERNVSAYWKADLPIKIDNNNFDTHLTVKQDNNGNLFWDAQVQEKSSSTDSATNPRVNELNALSITPDNGNVKYQLPADERDLVVQHTISKYNLERALDFGGLPVPSLAIVNKDTPFNFGGGENIQLIGNKEMIDPRYTPVYNRDIWSITFPQITYKNPTYAKAQKFKKEFKSYFDKAVDNSALDSLLYEAQRTSTSSALNNFINSTGAKLAYLERNGDNIELPKKNRDKELLKQFDIDEQLVEEVKDIDRNELSSSELIDAYTPIIKKYIDRKYNDSKYTEKQANILKEIAQEKYFDENGKIFFNKADNIAYNVSRFLSQKGLETYDTYEVRDFVNSKITDQDAYEKWATEQMQSKLLGDPMVEVGRKLMPFNIDNVVEAMTSKAVVNSQDSLVFGNGKIVAAGAKQLNSIEEIKIEGKKLVTEEQSKENMEQLNEDISTFMDAFPQPKDDMISWSFQREAIGKALAKMAQSDKPTAAKLKTALNRELDAKNDYPAELLDAGIKLVHSIKNLSRYYFEAKPQRAVDISEFSGAIVPTSEEYDEISAKLADKGLQVVRSDDSASAVKQFEDVFFQRAFAGSRVDYKRPSLEAIGSGEGNQAHGWGLYYALSRAVAEDYREQFLWNAKNKGMREAYATLTVHGKSFLSQYKVEPTEKLFDLLTNGSFGSTEEYLENEISRWENFKNKGGKDYGLADGYKKLLDDLYHNGMSLITEGQVHEVDIPENPYLLDEQKPFSEQSDFVKDRLNKLFDNLSDADQKRLKLISVIQNKIKEVNEKLADDFDNQDLKNELDELKTDLHFAQENEGVAELYKVYDKYSLLSASLAENKQGYEIYNTLKSILGSPKAASQALESVGIKGITYDGRQDGRCFVIFNPDDVKVINKFYQGQQAQEAYAAYIPLERKIVLFRNNNLSSLIHESGHWWLDTLQQIVASGKANDQLMQDWATIKDWLKVGDDNVITTEQHEQFARGVERYFRDRKAPSSKLKALFDKFNRWLKEIYKDVRELNVDLNDDVVRVFDHFLASDAEIEEYAMAQKHAAFMEHIDKFGLNPKELEKYSKEAAKTIELAKDRHYSDKIALMYKEETAEYKRKAEQLKDQVREEWAEADPINKAVYILTTGEIADGKLDIKINTAELRNLIGDDFEKFATFGGKKIYADDGLTINELTEFTGLKREEIKSGLLTARQRMDNFRKALQQRTHEQLGDPVSEEDIKKQVEKALLSDKTLDLMNIEMQALRRANGKEAVAVQGWKDWASRKVGQMVVKDLNPDQYLRQSQRSGDLVVQALNNGNKVGAMNQKMIQIRNYLMYLEVRARQEETESLTRRLKQIGKQEVNRDVDQVYQDAVRALLGRYSLSRALTQKAKERLGSLDAWILKQRENGYDIVVPQDLLDRNASQNYAELKVDDYLSLGDSVKSLLANGRAIKEHEIEGKILERDQFIADFAERIALTYKRRHIQRTGKKKFRGISESLAPLDAGVIAVGDLFNRIDDYNTNGPAHKILRMMTESQNTENEYLKLFGGKLKALTDALPKSIKAQLFENVDGAVQALGDDYTRGELIAIGLNMGNFSNLQRLTDGNGFTENQLNWVAGKLTKEEWDYIQGVWDVLESMYPLLAEHHKKMSGLDMDHVIAAPVKTPYGEYRGGYFPLFYDETPEVTSRRNNSVDAGALLEADYGRATTSTGYTKQRQERVALPIKLDLANINRHVASAIHDLAWRDNIRWLWNVVNHPDFIAAMDTHMHEGYRQMLTKLLRDLANSTNRDAREMAGFERLARNMRVSRTTIGLGFRVKTAIKQLTGFSQSIGIMHRYAGKMDGKHSGTYWLTKGTKAFATDKATRDWCLANSGELRTRLNNNDASIAEAMKEATKHRNKFQKFNEELYEAAFWAIGKVDVFTAESTWYGAYLQAKEDFGYNHKDAVFYADRVMIESQGSGNLKDKPAIQRVGEWGKMLTLFYSPFSGMYGLWTSAARDIRDGNHRARAMADLAIAMSIPAWLDAMVDGETPDSDDDLAEWLKFFLLNPLMFWFGTMPVAREIPSYLQFGRSQSMFGGIYDALDNGKKAVTSSKATAGKRVNLIMNATAQTLGAVGINAPIGGQIADWSQWIVDVLAGNVKIDSPMDVLWGLWRGKDGEPKK